MLLIFIFIISGNSNRMAQERFQHSGETIHRIFYSLMDALLALQDRYISAQQQEVQDEIYNNTKFYPYFKDCIGALDGTHIPDTVPVVDAIPFRNRKGFISQNVLAVCSFNMVFTYVLSGWEGSAHDGKVLQDAYSKGLEQRVGKYYLGDMD